MMIDVKSQIAHKEEVSIWNSGVKHEKSMRQQMHVGSHTYEILISRVV